MDRHAFETLKSLDLLYVEDDAETRVELAIMLSPWVANLYVAADGQEGLDLFKAKRPDLVVTDIQMPRVSGLAMSADIRRLVPDQPIIVLSAYNDTEYLFRAIEIGIDQYVTKPVNVERLLDKLAGMSSALLAVRERCRNQVLLEQYKHLVDESAIVCKLDVAGSITYVNDTMCAISGFARDDLIGRPMAELRLNGEERQRWELAFAEARSGGKWGGIIRNRSRNGEIYVVESSLVPILDEVGKVSEVVSLDVDITPIYLNYEHLVEGLERSCYSLEEQKHLLAEYKRALEMGSCICVVDRNFTVRSANKPFESLLGYPAKQLQGQSLSRIVPEFPHETCERNLRQADSGHYTNTVITCLASDGSEKQISVGCVGVHDRGGELQSIILICTDITESLRITREINETQRELLYMMGDVVESRSLETGQHVRRVAQISKFLALKIGLGREMAEMIEAAAPLHDIGKVGIRDSVLHKAGKLTPEEYGEMQHHARIGHHILGKVDRPLIALAAVIAHQHHEHYDGNGYPFGLKGEAISIAGRIVAIADVFDALSSPRVYKPAWEEQRVLEYFREQRGRQFDPDLVDLLVKDWNTVTAIRDSTACT